MPGPQSATVSAALAGRPPRSRPAGCPAGAWRTALCSRLRVSSRSAHACAATGAGCVLAARSRARVSRSAAPGRAPPRARRRPVGRRRSPAGAAARPWPAPASGGGSVARCTWCRSRPAPAPVDVATARRLDLRLQHRQRRPQLVRRVADEALLVLEQRRHPRQHAVEGFDNRLQFARRGFGSQRREVGRRRAAAGVDSALRTGRVVR